MLYLYGRILFDCIKKNEIATCALKVSEPLSPTPKQWANKHLGGGGGGVSVRGRVVGNPLFMLA